MSNEGRSQTITHSPLSSAVWTGLEPATPCVTGRYSNQLNYHTKLDLYRLKCLVKKRMSNANRNLTITHSPLSSAVWTGLEPATPCVTGRYSNQLNYHTKRLG